MGVKIFDGTLDDLGGGVMKENTDQEQALEDAVALKKEEEKHLEQNHGMRVALRPIKALNIMRVEVPDEIVDEINTHIDTAIIPANKSYADGLVGQLKNDEKELKSKIVKFRNDEIHHKDIAYKEGATKDGLYSIMDKIIKTGSKIAIGISEKI